MTTSDGSDNPRTERHVYGPRAVAALVPALVRPAFRRRAPAAAQVLADWPAIVGPAIAAISIPRKLVAGTLQIGCTGPMAMELQHLADQLIGRINTHMGNVTVTRLRFIQDVAAPVKAKPIPRPVAIQAAKDAVADVPDDALRDALESLGRAVLTRLQD
jgi:hypothetical protein